MSFEKFGEPVMLVRSPITTNPISGVMFNGSRPESCKVDCCPVGAGPPLESAATVRGGQSRTALAISRMCSGVVPQQPPTMLSQPFRAQPTTFGANDTGVSGKPVSDSGSGKPA